MKWINANKRLPEQGVEVLCKIIKLAWTDNKYAVGYMKEKSWIIEARHVSHYPDAINNCITEWAYIEKESISLRQSVVWFAEQMEQKLAKNDHKGGWAECDVDWLITRIEQELEELKKVYGFRKADWGRSVSDGIQFIDVSNEAIISECADISNFSMMVADRFGNDHCH